MNVVLFGQIRGDPGDLERALYGAPIVDFIRNHDTKEVTSEWLAGTAAFGNDTLGIFAGLSAILWFRLIHLDGPLRRAYKIYVNSQARNPMQLSVASALRNTCVRLATEPLE